MRIPRTPRYFISATGILALSGGVAITDPVAESQEGRPAAQNEPRAVNSVMAVRALIVNLEGQLAAQREQVKRTETSLQSARALLDALQSPDLPANSDAAIDNDRVRHARLPAQALIETMEWKWADEHANPGYCAQQLGNGYTAEVVRVPNEPTALTILVGRDGRVLYSWRGQPRSVFVVRAGVLYYADFEPGTSGCAVIAYDLGAQKLRWKSDLWGIGTPSHSKYSNVINLGFESERLVVYGNESFGRYIELVDPLSGKTIGHRREKHPGSPPQPAR